MSKDSAARKLSAAVTVFTSRFDRLCETEDTPVHEIDFVVMLIDALKRENAAFIEASNDPSPKHEPCHQGQSA